MSDIAIKVENLSKQYRLGQIGTGTISHDLNRWWHQIRGKEDPYLKIGEANDRSVKGNSEYVWALQDINFEVKQGEVLGIIGKNGAGKSTLLKILSKVTSPTTGSIKAKGRIASLLEVGTGFHPEMTGRENIFMNGTIMGMNRHEIRAKLDEIVEFAGVAKYLDTPVKRYSSGMTVRLGFAIAAHLEPEILIVDEVLAVGDAEFQKKAIGKMQDVSKGEGRTVLFVSHNMGSIKQLCSKGMVLSNGSPIYHGEIKNSIKCYLQNNTSEGKITEGKYLNKISLLNEEMEPVKTIASGEPFSISISVQGINSIPGAHVAFFVKDSMEQRLATFSTVMAPINQEPRYEKEEYIFSFDKNPLLEGSYFLDAVIAYKVGGRLEFIENVLKFDVIKGDVYSNGAILGAHFGKFYLEGRTALKEIK